MLKKTPFVFATLVLFACASLSQSHPLKTDKPSATAAARNPLTAGERLVYDVSWADFIVAAELTIETDPRRNFDGVDAYHVTATAKTVGLVSGLALKVNDVYDSYINASTLQPFRAEKRSRHGKKQTQSSVVLDQTKRVAQLPNGKTLELPDDTYDLAGLLFAIRGMDLTIGKSRTLTLIEDDKLYTIKVQPEGKEKVTTRAGSYEAIRIGTSMVKGRENDKLYNLKIFVSNDTRRMPVLITAEPSWGSVRVELISINNPGRSSDK